MPVAHTQDHFERRTAPPTGGDARPALDRRLFSVIVPVYNEEPNLEAMARRLLAVFGELAFDDHEILFVDDGSTDRSEATLRRLCALDRRVRALFLTRNFGHQAAVSVGIAECRGSVVAVIDGDLQDPPDLFAEMVSVLEAGADVAYGVRRSREEPALLRLGYWLFYRLQARLSSIAIPLDAGDFCCMRRPVVDAMVRLPESRRFVRGLRAWVGFRQVGVPYDRAARAAGVSKYRIGGLLSLAYDGLFAFSDLPVKLLQFLGFVVSLVAGGVGTAYLAYSILFEAPRGFPTLVISIWFLGGVQLLALGILGEYLHRTYEQSLGRPSALVRERAGEGATEDGR